MIPSEGAISELAIGAAREWEAFGSLLSEFTTTDGVDYRIFASTWPFITRASDALPNTSFLETLKQSLVLDHSIVGSNGFGRLSVGWGTIDLINSEADYDTVFEDGAVDGRRVLLKVGAVVDGEVIPYDDFYTIADLSATKWNADTETLTITLRDNSYRFDVPAQPDVYLGTGNLEGTTDLDKKRIPIAVGRYSYVTPAPVIPAEKIYQVSFRSVEEITAVYDGGVVLTFTADYATLALLRAATLIAGQYATCLAEGLFRLGGSSFKQVTVTGKGDNVGGYVETTADVVRRLINIAADVTDPGDFDTGAFDLLNAQQPAPVGYYLDYNSNESLRDVAGKLMGGIGGWCGYEPRTALIYVRRFAAPGIAPSEFYKEIDLIDFAMEPLPGAVDPPPRRFRVAYNRNWTIQTDIFGEVSENDPDRAAYLGTPYSLASTEEADSAAIVADHPLAPDPDPVESYFALQPNALAEAERLLALYRALRNVYRFKVKDRLLLHRVGQTIQLEHPRYHMTAGKNMRIVGLRENAIDNETEIAAVA